ncbi:MAG: hypothetical protein R6V00_03570 [Candidatus Aminicenantes bacterium]
MKKKIFFYLPYIGLFILVLSSFLLYLKIPFMETWFYSFSWWSFILIMDGINFRLNHSSFLFRSAALFVHTALFSVSVWLVFELINISLKNWIYLNLPENTIERWIGYFIAFATVIPALIELSEFFHSILPKKNLSLFRIKISSILLDTFLVIGVVGLILSLVLPKYFFPLVWLCFIFILDPINYKKNNPSLLKKMENNKWKVFWSWCLAGFTAGFVWEFLNFYSGTKWDYSIPFFDFAHIFQMPLLGYFGFIPFALEIYAVFQLFLHFKENLKNKAFLKYLIISIGFIFDIIVFYLIDVYSSFP